jgi:hypothetical protein
MNTAIDNYLTVHTKTWFLLPRGEKISAKELREILAMIENPKEEK